MLGPDPVTCRWDFGDGENAKSNRFSSHVYLQPGKYEVKANCREARSKTQNTYLGSVEIQKNAKSEIDIEFKEKGQGKVYLSDQIATLSHGRRNVEFEFSARVKDLRNATSYN